MNKIGELIKEFEGNDVLMIKENNTILFELYSTGIALGYINKSRGKIYLHKQRINKIVKNVDIKTIKIKEKDYLDLNNVRRLITLSKTTNKEKFIKWLQHNNYIQYNEVFTYKRKEIIFFDTLCVILKPMGYSLSRQVIDGNYRLDGYINELDMAIEYDENGHFNHDKDEEYNREIYIKSKYSYLVRVTDMNDLNTNIGIIMKHIIKTVQL